MKRKPKRKRHRPCWLRAGYGYIHKNTCRRYNDCCICAGWKDEGHCS